MIHYISQQLSGFPWIASADTLKTENLLPKFWSVAADLAVRSNRPDLIPADLQQTLTRLAGEDSNFDVLEHAAPCGFGFGASDGDGACFGFWLSEDWAEALETLGLGDDDPTGWAALIAELDADGIDPDTVEEAYQGRAEGYCEERAGADYACELAEDLGVKLDQMQWPLTCIDWDAAWRELEMGDGYRLHDLGGGEWLVFRSV